MATIKVTSSHSSVAGIIAYIENPRKTENCKYVSGFNCDRNTAAEEFMTTKRIYGKAGGRQYKHVIQSFSPDEKITPAEAHTIARELAQRLFPGFEVLIATHVDKKHIHSHLVVNSVSFESGRKFQQSKADLQRYKDISDEICTAHGKSLTTKTDAISSYSKGEYAAIETGQSWKLDCMTAVLEAAKRAQNRAEFIRLMQLAGWDTDWRDNHKYIVFCDEDGHKIRDKTLSKTFKTEINKEILQHDFNRKAENASRQRAIPNTARPGLQNLSQAHSKPKTGAITHGRSR